MIRTDELTRVNTSQRAASTSRAGGARVAVVQRSPDPLFLRTNRAPAYAGGKAGSRECPSDAKDLFSNSKVAAGDLES
jgi:hypothetical protein